MEKNYQIVIDAMGGDYAPAGTVGGALLALQKMPQISIVLTGTKEALDSQLAGKTYDRNRLSVHYTTQVVENEEESPVEAIRKKKDSSMAVGLQMVRDKQVDGFVSAGNTGALLAGATLIAGRIKGVYRPALTLAMPTGGVPTLLLDVGANMDPKPAYLVQFAEMASIYFRNLYHVDKPSVSLLNVGVEEGKGTELCKQTYDLLSKDEHISFAGNIEAREVMSGTSNIIVTDGFSGNILLKGLEGLASFVFTHLKTILTSSVKNKIGAALIYSSLKELKTTLDPRSVGGSPLLGINGAVIKAHGNSREDSIANAVEQCVEFIDTGVNAEIASIMEKATEENKAERAAEKGREHE